MPGSHQFANKLNQLLANKLAEILRQGISRFLVEEEAGISIDIPDESDVFDGVDGAANSHAEIEILTQVVEKILATLNIEEQTQCRQGLYDWLGQQVDMDLSKIVFKPYAYWLLLKLDDDQQRNEERLLALLTKRWESSVPEELKQYADGFFELTSTRSNRFLQEWLIHRVVSLATNFDLNEFKRLVKLTATYGSERQLKLCMDSLRVHYEGLECNQRNKLELLKAFEFVHRNILELTDQARRSQLQDFFAERVEHYVCQAGVQIKPLYDLVVVAYGREMQRDEILDACFDFLRQERLEQFAVEAGGGESLEACLAGLGVNPDQDSATKTAVAIRLESLVRQPLSVQVKTGFGFAVRTWSPIALRLSPVCVANPFFAVTCSKKEIAAIEFANFLIDHLSNPALLSTSEELDIIQFQKMLARLFEFTCQADAGVQQLLALLGGNKERLLAVIEAANNFIKINARFEANDALGELREFVAKLSSPDFFGHSEQGLQQYQRELDEAEQALEDKKHSVRYWLSNLFSTSYSRRINREGRDSIAAISRRVEEARCCLELSRAITQSGFYKVQRSLAFLDDLVVSIKKGDFDIDDGFDFEIEQLAELLQSWQPEQAVKEQLDVAEDQVVVMADQYQLAEQRIEALIRVAVAQEGFDLNSLREILAALPDQMVCQDGDGLKLRATNKATLLVYCDDPQARSALAAQFGLLDIKEFQCVNW